MTLNELIGGAETLARLTGAQSELVVAGLTADSRKVRPGFLFAALPGTKADGRSFMGAAVSQGASAILLPEGSAAAVPANVALLPSANPRRSLALLAARFVGVQPKVIAAVTGTAGKTSTTVFLRQLWSLLGHRAGSLGTIGLVAPGLDRSESLTTPDPIELHQVLAELAAHDVDHLAMEASSHGLDQFRLDGVQLSAAAFTNLSRDHLDYHGSMEAYLGSKLRLFDALLPAGGGAVINADMDVADSVVAVARTRHQQLITFGRNGREIRLIRQTPTASGQLLELEVMGRRHELVFPVVGLFQAQNMLAALGLAIGSGADPATATAMIGGISGVHGRIEHVANTPSGGAVYVDYAHKPAGLEAVLQALRPHASGKLVVLFGCGGDRDKGKRPQMGEIAARLADRVIVTDDNPRTEDPAVIRKEVLAGAKAAEEIGDRAAAIRAAMNDLGSGDLLVIAGKGHETYQIIGETKYPFDDSEVARKIAGELAVGTA